MTSPGLSRELQRATRQFADSTSSRMSDIPSDRIFRGTVTTVTPGGAANGVDALIKVTYRGKESTVAGYPDSYTPAVGHRVLCVITEDHQLEVLHRSIGAPSSTTSS